MEEEVVITEAEKSEEVQSAYDRIANPEKVQEQNDQVIEKATETPPIDELAELRAQVGKIPDVLKQLNDVNGRYGRLTQRFEEMQARKATPDNGAAAAVATADVEDMLKDIKEEFDEDGLYNSLKNAFSKLAAGKSVDPDSIEKMVSDRIAATKQAETEAALAQLTEARPTWMQDRQLPEFAEWRESLSVKERAKLDRSTDPYFVAERLDDFDAWKARKVHVDVTPPAVKKSEHAPSKRLASAVMPTTGTKPKIAGEDDKPSQIRAAYERVAGARLR